MTNRPFLESDYNTSYSSATPSEQASQRLMNEAKSLNRINNLLSGSQTGGSAGRSRKQQRRSRSRRNQRGGGRTLDVPLPSVPFKMPGPSYNNAWYVGEPCVGNHCGVPITPYVSEYIHNALNSSTPGANTQYPLIDRLGNSLGENLPGVQPYQGTELNPGPFQFNCVGGGRRQQQKKNSKKQQRRSRGRRN